MTMLGLGKNERAWNEYMDKERSSQELVVLLKDETMDDFFRDRSLRALLTYDFSCLGFKVKSNYNYKSYLYLSGVPELPKDKIDLAVEILIQNIIAVRKKKSYLDEWCKYNYLILNLLPKIPQEKREELWQYFEINDVSVYDNVEECSGYNPLKSLLDCGSFYDSYKKLAVEKMHQIILDEFNGKLTPRKPHEDAFERYRYILYMMMYGDNLQEKADFFEEEITFLLSINNGKGATELGLTTLYPMIKNKETRRLLFERQLNCPNYPFRIHDTDRVELALKVMQEFPDFKAKIDIMIDEHKQRQKENIEIENKNKEKETNILNKMKKSLN